MINMQICNADDLLYQMNESYPPNLFLFHNYIEEVIKEGKKHIKTAPFDSIDPESLFNNDHSQYFDLYHTYFLAAMGHAKTREIACLNYEKLIRQELVDKGRLPVSMISSVLTACANIGGSTSGSSSLGSASLNSNPQNQNLYIGNLVKSILLHTYQPISELNVGLNYLLEGSRKKYSLLYNSMLQEVYSSFLVRLRQPAINRLVSSYLNELLDEVQAHFKDEHYVFASRKMDQQTGKMDIAVYSEDKFGKFGRCFICRKEADHYMKEQFIPICSISCKERVKDLLQQCQSNDQFNVLGWVIDNMASGDQIVYSFLVRELQAFVQSHTLSWGQLLQITKGLSAHIQTSHLHKYLLPSLSLIVTRWQDMIATHEVSHLRKEQLQGYFKIYYIQILNTVQELPIGKEQLDFIIFFNEVLKHEPILLTLFTRYDCRFFQPNILGRILNLLSQYARKFEVAVDGLHAIVKNLAKRYVQRSERLRDWSFLAECSKKKQLKKAITLFNKKPLHGIKHFKKIFQNTEEQTKSKEWVNEPESPIKMYGQGKRIFLQVHGEKEDVNKKQEAAQQKQQLEGEQQIKDQEQQIKQQNESSILEQERIIPSTNHQPQQVEKDRVRVTPRHIALFIRQFTEAKSFYQVDQRQPIKLPLLSQAMVGQYFGLNNEQARQVAQAYLSTFVFQNYQIDDTMRIVLNSFSLPKETQMVDRVIGDIAKRLVGLYGLKNDTESYQYFYLLLMVQTTNHNPNVRESERLKLENFLKMCQSMIGRIPEKAERDYNRILEHSLNVKIKYSEEEYFSRKYLGQVDRWTEQLFGPSQVEGSEAKHLLNYIWEYLVIGLIWPGNSKGLYQSVILLGKQGLAAEQRAFFEALRKEGPPLISRDAIIKIGMEHGNQLHGDLWNTVISLIYKLQHENQFSSAVLDKLFTNSSRLNALRLKDFLRALLQFSKSQIMQDSLYTRELFVLRHINSLLQYNIPRFGQIALFIWPLLEDYFKDICLHPRKEVSMGAIDSFKQLVLKLLKLQQQAVPQEALMETFLHIFERSCLEMKDFIANVLLNVITIDLRDGWESIYQILDILDTKDKQLVVKILGRLIGQIGLERLTNLHRLHAICMKQLRICGQVGVVEQLLGKLWQLSSYINDMGIWLQTIRSIKDIFKISLNNDILQVFIRMCNQCLQLSDKEIFTEIVDICMFLLDFKANNSKGTALFLTSLQTIKLTNPHFVAKFIGGSYGFLSVFQLYLSSHLKIPFAIFLKAYFAQILLPILMQKCNQLQFEQFSLWCINQYYDNLPLELINLKEKDRDFEKTLSSLLLQKSESGQKQGEVQLIQFHLSNKEYKEKTVIHLIFLDIAQSIYKQNDKNKSVKIRAKVEESVIDSYECAFKINKLIFMRNFLWRNGFLSSKHLPGLHRQQHRTLIFMIREFPFPKIYPLIKGFIRHYLTVTILFYELQAQTTLPKTDKKKNNESYQKEVKSSHPYIYDAELWLNQAHRSVCGSMAKIRGQLLRQRGCLEQGELWELVNMSLQLLSLSIPAKVCNETSETLRSLYDTVI